MNKINAIDELAEELISFLSNYEIQDIFISNDGNRNQLRPRNERTCRFCNKSYPAVKFKAIAHLIPKSFGNNSLKSDFECDTCNGKFSLFETDFASILGIHKTLSPNNEERRTFTSNTVVAKEITLTSGKTVTWIINKNLNQRAFKLDEKKGKLEIEYVKPAYTPINVYKLFLKIGISCLRPEEIVFYQPLLHLLQTNNDKVLSPFAINVSAYELSFKVQSPRVIVYKRTNPECHNLLHHVQIYFQEFVFLIPMPLNTEDRNLYENTNLNLNLCPPVFLDDPIAPINYHRGFIDLSSLDKVSEKDLMSIISDPLNFNNLSSFDGNEGIKNNINLDGVQIEGIIQIKEGETLDKQDMLELQNLFRNIRGGNMQS